MFLLTMLMGKSLNWSIKYLTIRGKHQSYFDRLQRICYVEYCLYECHRYGVLLMSYISGGSEYNLNNTTTNSKLASRKLNSGVMWLEIATFDFRIKTKIHQLS